MLLPFLSPFLFFLLVLSLAGHLKLVEVCQVNSFVCICVLLFFFLAVIVCVCCLQVLFAVIVVNATDVCNMWSETDLLVALCRIFTNIQSHANDSFDIWNKRAQDMVRLNCNTDSINKLIIHSPLLLKKMEVYFKNQFLIVHTIFTKSIRLNQR